jgi:HD-GYP domain-containing protein (c-di-GMP phosphodiesterase class II)
MRRIALKDAKPNMMLSMPAYDDYGQMILDEGAVIKLEHVQALVKSGVSRLIIEDPRVSDVILSDLVPKHVEARAIKAVRQMMDDVRSGQLGGGIAGVMGTAHDMAQYMEDSIMGEPDVMGCSSLSAYAYVHPVQSAIISMVIAKAAAYEPQDILRVGESAMLQDIGYALIPKEILEKNTTLTDEELQKVSRHSEYAAEVLKRYPKVQRHTIEAVYQHHERWDGTGYPNGTKGWDIPPHAQMVAIADIYCDLISTRPDRKAYTIAAAVEYIMGASGELFDPELVEVFARRIPMYPTGVMVKLASGEVGIVIDPNIGAVGRPKIRICAVPHPRQAGLMSVKPYDVDLTAPDNTYMMVQQII